MKLSPGEKLILVMLADIHKHLKIEGEIDPDFVINAVNGDSWGLSWKYSGLTGEEPDPDVVEETAEILSMWRVIDGGLTQLSPTDRTEVEAAAGPYALKFEGFDGNHDPHYGVACFLVEHLGRFDEHKRGMLNSHTSSSLPRYRSMLSRLKAIQAKTPRYPLGKDQLLSILKG